MNMPKSRYTQAYIPLTWVIWNFGYITVNGANGNDSVKKDENIVYCRTLTLYHDEVKIEIDYAAVGESGQL